MRAVGNEHVAGRIQHSEGSIGYVGYEFARRLDLKMASLQNKAGNFVKPGDQAGMAALSAAELPANLRLFIADPAGADAYPIVTFSWILIYKTCGAFHDGHVGERESRGSDTRHRQS